VKYGQHSAVLQRGGVYPDGQQCTLYTVSTSTHDIREYDVFESPQPWYRPTPVTEAEYVGKLAHHATWRLFRFSIAETYKDIWRVFQTHGIGHLQYWTGYHMVSAVEVQGIDAYFRYWCPGTPLTYTWERYWLRDSTAVCMTCTL